MSEQFWNDIRTFASTREANVETWLVLPLLEALGHDRSCIDAKVPVLFQEGRKARPGRKPEADFVVHAERPFSRATSLIVVETKRTDEELDEGESQGESYAQNLRAPILLTTNGRRLEVWQIQVTTDSVRVLDCDVAELAARRGDLEALVSKDAIKAHCRTIEYKRFDLLARDMSAYERAEYHRVDAPARGAIPRRLRDAAAERTVGWEELLTMQGALVVAPSAYGKTTLAAILVREGVERRWEGRAETLPLSVFLPDLQSDGRPLEAYLADRVAAHKPGFSTATLASLARGDGLLVVADAFERVAPGRRDGVRAMLRTFLLDFPKTRLIVLSRGNAAPNDLGLPLLRLEGYTPDDLRDLASKRSDTHPNAVHAFSQAPAHAYRVGEVPLLADRVLDHYEKKRRHSFRLAPLYDMWLSAILANAPSPIDRALDLVLLERLASETASGPVPIERALELAGGRPAPSQVLEQLAEADAIHVVGTTVELRHEALADYLRAIQFWKAPRPTSAAELAELAFDPASEFANLLVDTAPDADRRGQAWQAVAKADLRSAVRSLRFAAGDEAFGAAPASGQHLCFLRDIREAIETLLAAHLQPVAAEMRMTIAGQPVELLGIEGALDAVGVSYAFPEAKGAPDAVVVGRPDLVRSRAMYGHTLRRVGYGSEAGRILGVQHVRDALQGLTKARQLRGGPVWIEERVFGRLRHLVERYDFSGGRDLRETLDALRPHAGQHVAPDAFSSGQTFSIEELLSDLEWLLARGKSSLDRWWDDPAGLDLRSDDGRRRLASGLDEYYRRRQVAYAEVVEHSFPGIRPHLRTLRMMPFRMEIEVEFQTRHGSERATLRQRRWPVEGYSEAGADVTFPDSPTEIHGREAMQAYAERTDALLSRFGRFFPDRVVSSEWSIMPDFLGRDTSFDGLPDESAVVRGAAKLLKADLDELFSETPTYGFDVNQVDGVSRPGRP